MDQTEQWRRQRGTLVGVMLFIMLAAGIMGFWFLVCGGLALPMMGIIALLTLVGYAHFLIWGRSLSREVGPEREAEQARQRLEAEDWSAEEDEPPTDFGHGYRRF